MKKSGNVDFLEVKTILKQNQDDAIFFNDFWPFGGHFEFLAIF